MFLTLIFIVFVITATNGQNVQNCDVSQELAEKNFHRFLFYGDRDAYFPSNENDVTKYCHMVQANVNNYTQFTRCLKPFPKQIFGLVAKGFKKYTKTRCASPKWRKQFVDFGNCVKSNKLEENLHGCVDKATLMNEFIEHKVKSNHKTSMACCVTQVMSNCFRAKSKVCGNELSAFPFHMINEPIAEVFELMCGSLNSLQKCSRRYPSYMQDIRDLLRSGMKPIGSFFKSQLRVAFGVNS